MSKSARSHVLLATQANPSSNKTFHGVVKNSVVGSFRAGLLAAVLAMPCMSAQDKFAELRKQDQKMIREAPGSRFNVHVGKPVPNVELPAHVAAAENKVTFFADFENAGPKGVPLYLVNRTERSLDLMTQDHDPYLKLEYLDEQGRWIRAQPHTSSWCGNSYYPVTLPSGQHLRFSGYQASEGAPATVRYRCVGDSELVSNFGPGRVHPADLAAASMDDMAAASIPMALRNVLDISRRNQLTEKIEPRTYVAALRLLFQYSESPYYRREAEQYLETLDMKSPEAAAIKSLLDQQGPLEPDRLRLLKYAHAVVSGKETDAGTTDKELALKVIGDLLMDSKEEVNPEWSQAVRQIFAHIGEFLIHWNGSEADAAAGVLAVSKAADEFVESDKLRAWLEHGNKRVVETSANALSRRGDWLFLADKGFQLNLEARILVLKALACGGIPYSRTSRNPESARESEFWKHCATLEPVQTVQALQYIGSSGMGRHPFNMVLHVPLRAFLQKEADLAEHDPQAASNEKHGYPVAQVLQFVGAWQRKEDVPLFRRLLKHPGFQSATLHESSGRRFEVRTFRVRKDAKEILHTMGVSVPDNVVLEEKMPLLDKPGNK